MTKDEKRAWVINYVSGLSLADVIKYRDKIEAYVADHPEELENDKTALEDVRQILVEAIKKKEGSGKFRPLVWFVYLLFFSLVLALLLQQIFKS